MDQKGVMEHFDGRSNQHGVFPVSSKGSATSNAYGGTKAFAAPRRILAHESIQAIYWTPIGYQPNDLVGYAPSADFHDVKQVGILRASESPPALAASAVPQNSRGCQ